MKTHLRGVSLHCSVHILPWEIGTRNNKWKTRSTVVCTSCPKRHIFSWAIGKWNHKSLPLKLKQGTKKNVEMGPTRKVKRSQGVPSHFRCQRLRCQRSSLRAYRKETPPRHAAVPQILGAAMRVSRAILKTFDTQGPWENGAPFSW